MQDQQQRVIDRNQISSQLLIDPRIIILSQLLSVKIGYSQQVQANFTEIFNARTYLQRDWCARLTAGLTKGRFKSAFATHPSPEHHLAKRWSESPASSLAAAC